MKVKHIECDIEPIIVNIKDVGSYSMPPGILLGELFLKLKGEVPGEPVAAIINNRTRGMHYRLVESCNIEPVDIYSPLGIRVIVRSSTFLLSKACWDVFPDRKLIIRHMISNGVYAEFMEGEISSKELEKISERVQELIDLDIPLNRLDLMGKEAREIFNKQGQPEKIQLLGHRNKERVYLFELDGYCDYFYNHVFYSTGVLKKFRLLSYPPGMVFQNEDVNRVIAPYKEQKKLSQVYEEAKDWGEMLNTPHIAALNNISRSGDLKEIIQVNEALHEKKIAYIADQISSNPRIRVVLISGPSSSGKTTFAQRLLTQLKVNGRRPVTISLDNYFVDRDKTPLDEEGRPDFDSIEALDIELFNDHLQRLIEGEEVKMPVYNFYTGLSEPESITLKVPKGEPIILEGIHALNQRLTWSVPQIQKYKIFVSALTQLNLDYSNRISTTDSRLIRRIVRDNRTRGLNPINTIKQWPSVRKGEERNIFPYQEEADIFFNSSLLYELAVLKPMIYPLLREISIAHPERIGAIRLVEFLSFVRGVPLQDVFIPINSILREFIGGISDLRH